MVRWTVRTGDGEHVTQVMQKHQKLMGGLGGPKWIVASWGDGPYDDHNSFLSLARFSELMASLHLILMYAAVGGRESSAE